MRLIAVLLLLVIPVGCDGESEDDAGARSDAGARRDAGAPSDAATSSDSGATDAGSAADAGPPRPLRVLVFSRTTGFRHPSIADGVRAATELASTRGWTLETTEDAAALRAALPTSDVVVFLNTTGDILSAEEQTDFESWVRAGGGWVGVHSAADTEYDWAFYGELLGAYFDGHPAPQNATLVVEDRAHPATSHLDATWTRRDEWYNFRRNPRPDVRVLITIDETTYSGGTMPDDHPVAWAHEVGSGRAFYTALGHTSETYDEPEFRSLLVGAVEWASGR